VIDNTPFGQTKRPSVGASEAAAGFEAHETATPGPTLGGPALSKGKSHERKTSVAFFGSLRGLFKHKPKEHKGPAEWEDVGGFAQASPLVRNKGGGGGWVTRTDAHLKGSKRGRGDSDSESETTVVVPKASIPPPVGGSKLRKSRTGTLHPSPTVPPATTRSASSSGWLSDGPATASPRGSVKRKKKKSVAELRGGDEGHTDGEIERGGEIGARDRFNLVPGVRAGIGSGDPSYRSPPDRSQDNSQRQHQAPSPTRPTTQMSHVHDTVSRRSSLSRTSILSAPGGTISPPRSYARSATMDFSSGGNGTSVLNGSSPGTPRRSISIAYGSSSSTHTHPGTADAQGTSNESKPKKNTRQGTLHTPHSANRSASQSLMSIVEDVARHNRDGWGAGAISVPPLPNGARVAARKTQPVTLGSGRLQVPKAPSLGVPAGEREVTNGGEKQTRSLDLPRAPSSVASVSTPKSHSRPSSSPPLSRVGSSNAISATPTPTANGHVPSSRPAKSPLRSALRNSSRTPSPGPAQLVELRGRVQEIVHPSAGEVDDPRRKIPERDSRPPLSPPSPRDSASISSYETGRENFDVEPETMLFAPLATRSYSPPLPPPPPPHDDPPSSNASTETPLARRKSVRVSLHPTFSPTPPASYDNDEEAHAPWSKSSSSVDGVGWKMKVGHVPDGDLWQDSSEEDEEYSRARRLLSRSGKRDKGKGKGKA
jgi:hypothetical protein